MPTIYERGLESQRVTSHQGRDPVACPTEALPLKLCSTTSPEVYSAGGEVGQLDMLRGVFVTAQSPQKLANVVQDTNYVVQGQGLIIPASIFQPATMADTYDDGVSLPASSSHCLRQVDMARSSAYGRFRTDLLWSVPVLHPSFKTTVKSNEVMGKHHDELVDMEVMLSFDGQPTMVLTSPDSSFIDGIGGLGCALSVNPKPKYAKVTLVAGSLWAMVGLWFCLTHYPCLCDIPLPIWFQRGCEVSQRWTVLLSLWELW